jgi:hypothetical protein
MPSDDPQDVDGNAGVSHPGEPGVAESVAAELLEAEFGDNVVPVGRIAEDSCGDAAAPGAGE